LLQLTPNEASLIEFDEAGCANEKLIDVSLVQIGDILKINPGGRIPCDGVLFKGPSFIDESMLTGETIPVSKTLGSDVMAGTVNLTCQILIKVSKVGSDTTISRIIKLVQDAQSSKPPIQALAGT
jgi:Cu+-exporting ATPase